MLVMPNGQFEMTAQVAAVLNRIAAAYKHETDAAFILGGTDAKLIVAYTNNCSIGACLIKARHRNSVLTMDSRLSSIGVQLWCTDFKTPS